MSTTDISYLVGKTIKSVTTIADGDILIYLESGEAFILFGPEGVVLFKAVEKKCSVCGTLFHSGEALDINCCSINCSFSSVD